MPGAGHLTNLSSNVHRTAEDAGIAKLLLLLLLLFVVIVIVSLPIPLPLVLLFDVV